MVADSQREFLVAFDSPQDFEKTLQNRGPDTGLFFKSGRPVKVGEHVWIRISIKGMNSPLFLEGRVQWRRVRPGGPDLPAGVFVGLVDRERAHLDAIMRYVRSGQHRRERRVHPRYPLFLDASYNTSKGEFQSETRNVSLGGAYLRCTGPLLSVGARFPMMIFITGKDGKGVAINAQVAWIDLFEDTKGMGVAFIHGQAVLKQIARVVVQFEKELKKHRHVEA